MLPQTRAAFAAIRLAAFIAIAFPVTADCSDAEFVPELVAVKTALSAILSPLRADYSREIELATAKQLLEQRGKSKLSKPPPKPEYRCYLSQREIVSFLVRGNPVDKNFRFRKDCHIDGRVQLSKEVFRVDLTLKESGSYYRVRFLMELQGILEKKTGLVRVKARVYDGELFIAERTYEPEFEFLADYTMVLDEAGGAVSPGRGTLYVKSFSRKKVDRLLPLELGSP